MTDEDIERLARAICESRGIDPDLLVRNILNHHTPQPAPIWTNYQDFASDFLACQEAIHKEHAD